MKKKAQCILLHHPDIGDYKKPQPMIGMIYKSPNGIMHKYERPSSFDTPYKYQHLYFTLDEEIKDGDWVLNTREKVVEQIKSKEDLLFINTINKNDEHIIFKVVTTTNPELWYKGPFNEKLGRKTYGDVGQIGDDFIEAYIKAYNEGKPITEVMLEYTGMVKHKGGEFTPDFYVLKLRSNGTVIISPVVEKMYTREQRYEVALKIFTSFNDEEFNEIKMRDAYGLWRGKAFREWFDRNYPQ